MNTVPLEITPSELSALIASVSTMFLLAEETKATTGHDTTRDPGYIQLLSVQKKLIAAQTAMVAITQAQQS